MGAQPRTPHSHLGVAPQRVLQQVGQLAVAIRDVGLLGGDRERRWGALRWHGLNWGGSGGALGPHTFLARAMMTNPKEDRLVLMDCVSRSRFPWD